MYFRQAWRDPRLSFQPIYNKTEIRLHDGSWDDFWIPDTAACVLLVLPVPGGYDDLPRVNPTRPVARESGRVGSSLSLDPGHVLSQREAGGVSPGHDAKPHAETQLHRTLVVRQQVRQPQSHQPRTVADHLPLPQVIKM